MHKLKTFEGFCPEQSKFESIEVRYIRYRPPKTSETIYIKNGFHCDRASRFGCRFLRSKECPLYTSVPRNDV